MAMGKLSGSLVAVRSGWESHMKPRVSMKRASRAARRLVDRLTEDEKIAVLGLVAGLGLKWISMADPRARIVLLVLLLVVNEALSSYLDVDSGRTVSAVA